LAGKQDALGVGPQFPIAAGVVDLDGVVDAGADLRDRGRRLREAGRALGVVV